MERALTFRQTTFVNDGAAYLPTIARISGLRFATHSLHVLFV